LGKFLALLQHGSLQGMCVKLNVSCSEWWFKKKFWWILVGEAGRVLKGFVAVVGFSVFRFLFLWDSHPIFLPAI
jgi:hypothetical protein